MSLRFQRLTRPALRNLTAGQRINEHGIVAERLSNGDVRFAVNVMIDGQRVHRVIGRESDGTTREQAERAIENYRTKAREGRLDLPTGRKKHRSFAQAGEEYLTRIENQTKHGRNLSRKTGHLRQRLIPYFGKLRPDKVTDFTIGNYVRLRKEQGSAVATINRELSTLSHFLNRCVEWGWIKQRAKIDKGEEARKQIVVLSQADQKALMQAAIKDQDPMTWLFVAIAMGTGMRHSEVMRIKWEHMDFANRRIFLPTAKAGGREQPMPPTLADTLAKERKQLGDPDGWLFPTARADAKYEHRQTMSEQFRRAVKRAKLDPAKVTPHILRHTAITGLVKAGVDLPTIQRISGHKTLAMVLRYTQLTDDHIDRHVAKLEAAFSGVFTPDLHTGPKTALKSVA